jgi:GNAT superfamily N-acetyltransferase
VDLIQPAGHRRNGVEISYLADHPEVLGDLAAGFKAQWADHFADQSVDAIKMGFANCCRDCGLPVALVAMVDQTFAGTASLREESGTVCPGLGPWLTHLYIVPALRNRGIGTTLIRAVETEAIRNGYRELHAATARAAAVFERRGWQMVQVVEYHGDRVSVLKTRLTSQRKNEG